MAIWRNRTPRNRCGAPTYLLTAPETAAGAARADHARLMKSVYWGAPVGDQGELILASGEQ